MSTFPHGLWFSSYGWVVGSHGEHSKTRCFCFLGMSGLKEQKNYSLTALEARSPKSKCWGYWGVVLPLKAPERNPSLPVCNIWWLSAVLDIPWLVAGSIHVLPLFLRDCLPFVSFYLLIALFI